MILFYVQTSAGRAYYQTRQAAELAVVGAGFPVGRVDKRFCLRCREVEGDCHCRFLGVAPMWDVSP